MCRGLGAGLCTDHDAPPIGHLDDNLLTLGWKRVVDDVIDPLGAHWLALACHEVLEGIPVEHVRTANDVSHAVSLTYTREQACSFSCLNV